jgi:hypothetical protein
MHALLLQDLGATQEAREAWAALARERPDLPELAGLAASACILASSRSAAVMAARSRGRRGRPRRAPHRQQPVRHGAAAQRRQRRERPRARLKELGFKVIVRENATRRDMYDAIREFGRARGREHRVLLLRGPRDAVQGPQLPHPDRHRHGLRGGRDLLRVELQQVFDRIEKARTRYNFLVLDAAATIRSPRASRCRAPASRR